MKIMNGGWQIKYSKKYLYWLGRDDFTQAKRILVEKGWRLKPTVLTPCQVLKAEGKTAVYASPEAWSRICVRQGSWYRASKRAGQFMIVSEQRLPSELDAFMDAEISESGFRPPAMPDRKALQQLVDSEEYRSNRPADWERIGLKDAFLFKTLFTTMRFWGRGDTLKKHWLSQRANHANFLARRFTTRLDGEDVPYSVSENSGVCSSCVEFFNLAQPNSRKLVRACPGAAIFAGAPRDAYLDVKPRKDASQETSQQISQQASRGTSQDISQDTSVGAGNTLAA